MGSTSSPLRQDDQQDSKEYEVGYGKPPISTRFKPGQSGNRHGRPKPNLGPTELLRALLTKTVAVQEGDKKRRMTKLELLLNNAINAAIKRESGAFQSLITLLKLLPDALEIVAASPATRKLSNGDIAVLKAFLADKGDPMTDLGDDDRAVTMPGFDPLLQRQVNDT